MGVNGLMSFIERKGDILIDLQFRCSGLIIDGCNLYYTLFYDNELDQMYGGDYDVFEHLLITFFTNLKDCDIDPVVLLDGGADHTDRKFDTVLQRDKDKVRKAFGLSMKKEGCCPPLLLKNIFMQTLDKLKVPYVQCIEEADVEVATLAKWWNCPILSNDSDFYIFDIPAGILPLKDFQWKNVNGTNQKYIPSKLFKVERLCSSFNRMNRGLLPIFACILGNDYVKLQNIASLKWEKHGGKFARIDDLLQWLSKFSEPEAAIDDILKQIPDNKDKDGVREALCKGIEDYELKTSTALTGPLQALPDWTLKHLKHGKMGSFLINILILKRVIITPQVEDFMLPSSSETSRPIRQVLYGLILLGEQQTAGKHVIEYIRQVINEESNEKFSLTCSKVGAIETKVIKGLQLETLNQEPRAVRLQVFLDTLGVSSSDHIKTIPCHLQLQVIMTHYWMVNAQPKPKDPHVWALLLGMVHGQLSNTQKVEFVKLKSKKRIRLDREVAHLYSQWQDCLWWSLNLNRLLCFPLPEPECARLYSGTLVHRIVRELKRDITPESLLEKDSYAERLFRRLRDAVKSLIDEYYQNQSLDELHSVFQHSESENIEYSEDDDHVIDTLESSSIRPRHKTKERNANHPTNKSQRRCFE